MPAKKTYSGRQKGAISYNNELILKLVRHYLPTGSDAWEKIADQYLERSNETERRLGKVIKRQWTDKMCNKNKSITGESGPNRFTKRCQEVQLLIEQKSAQRSTAWEESSDSGSQSGGSNELAEAFSEEDELEDCDDVNSTKSLIFMPIHIVISSNLVISIKIDVLFILWIEYCCNLI